MGEINIGPKIEYYLSLKKISHKDFAKLCGINEATLSRYISGEREPRYSVVMKMAYVLGISMDEITSMDDYLIKKYVDEIWHTSTTNADTVGAFQIYPWRNPEASG